MKLVTNTTCCRVRQPWLSHQRTCRPLKAVARASTLQQHVTVDGHKLFVTVSGDGQPGKPPVLLLHGFPDSHALWDKQVPALTAAGHQVIAPDLIGMGQSEKPKDLQPYTILNVIKQLLAVLDELKVPKDQKLVVVGHDFGAGVAWLMAALHRERVEKLVVLSVGFFGNYFAADPAQRNASWYMLFFVRPEAEELLKQDDWALLRVMMSADPTASSGLLQDQVRRLGAPGALNAGLNWYRANVDIRSMASTKIVPLDPPLDFPVLGIVGDKDVYCLEKQMRASEGAAVVSSQWRMEVLPGCGHWIPLQEPNKLNALLTEFLAT